MGKVCCSRKSLDQVTGAPVSSFDFIVIGGGLMGMAVAYGLVQRGHSVAVIDGGAVPHRASLGNFGLVWVQSKGDGKPEYARWTRQSVALWDDFAAELEHKTGIDVAYDRRGGYHFAFSQEELRSREVVLKRICAEAGLVAPDFEILDRKAVVDAFPGLGPDVCGASFCPEDGDCNTLLTLSALQRAFTVDGGRYFPGHTVTGVEASGPGAAVDTDRGRFSAGAVVLAAGVGNLALARAMGCELPVRPIRGQILVSERAAPVIRNLTHIVRQTREGSIMFGDSHEDVGLDDSTTVPAMRDIAANAIRTFPFLRSLRIVRVWACLRPMPLDGYPIYDRIPGHRNAFVLNSHSGVTLAAVHARILARQLVDGNIAGEGNAFAMDRFNVLKTG